MKYWLSGSFGVGCDVLCCVMYRSSPGEDVHRFAGSETESEAAALDKEFWVKRASEVGLFVS